jgi:hypothetical protein
MYKTNFKPTKAYETLKRSLISSYIHFVEDLAFSVECRPGHPKVSKTL